MNTKLSAVIITKNEEENILRCISALQSITDEILIVDSGSTDRTLELCKKEGVNIIQTAWLGYAQTKNLGNREAKNKFILSIDADEEVSEELKNSILAEKERGFQGTYSFNRLTNYLGKWVKRSGWYPDEKIRIFNKNEVKWVGDYVHETLSIPSKIKNTKLNGDLNHYSYSSFKDHRTRADNYSELTAKKLFKSGKSASFLKPVLSPIVRFLKMYIVKLGFLDGSAGFHIARISAESNRFKYKELNRLHKLKKNQENIKHVLISRTDSIGDVMLTLPMAKAIKDELPHVKISFLAKNYTKPLIECCQWIDDFILYKEGNEPHISEELDTVIHALPSQFLAKTFSKKGIPRRVGTARRFYNILTCNKLAYFTRKKSDFHEAQLNLKLLDKLNLKSRFSLESITELYGFSPQAKLPDGIQELVSSQPKIILHPKSQGSAPEWELKNFNDLAEKLAEQGFQIFLSGTESEGLIFREHIDFDSNIIDVSGTMSLHEFIAFIDVCDGLVASSTGPLHIAAALEKNVLGLYSNQRPMFPTRWAPIGKKATYLHSEPKHGLLNNTVDEVLTKIIADFEI